MKADHFLCEKQQHIYHCRLLVTLVPVIMPDDNGIPILECDETSADDTGLPEYLKVHVLV